MDYKKKYLKYKSKYLKLKGGMISDSEAIQQFNLSDQDLKEIRDTYYNVRHRDHMTSDLRPIHKEMLNSRFWHREGGIFNLKEFIRNISGILKSGHPYFKAHAKLNSTIPYEQLTWDQKEREANNIVIKFILGNINEQDSGGLYNRLRAELDNMAITTQYVLETQWVSLIEVVKSEPSLHAPVQVGIVQALEKSVQDGKNGYGDKTEGEFSEQYLDLIKTKIAHIPQDQQPAKLLDILLVYSPEKSQAPGWKLTQNKLSSAINDVVLTMYGAYQAAQFTKKVEENKRRDNKILTPEELQSVYEQQILQQQQRPEEQQAMQQQQQQQHQQWVAEQQQAYEQQQQQLAMQQQAQQQAMQQQAYQQQQQQLAYQQQMQQEAAMEVDDDL